jgi:hypothetical protein
MLSAWVLMNRGDRRLNEIFRRGRRLPVGGISLGVLFLGFTLLGPVSDAACGPSRAPRPEVRSTSTRTAGSYAITVKAPSPVKKGEAATAVIQVMPRGPYKINLEFPLRLKVGGPASASPRELQLTAKQAAKMTKSELVLKPSFKLTAGGEHAFSGTLRFSVCTDAQCEIKTEPVSWVAVCR